jgi:hypothetical protein
MLTSRARRGGGARPSVPSHSGVALQHLCGTVREKRERGSAFARCRRAGRPFAASQPRRCAAGDRTARHAARSAGSSAAPRIRGHEQLVERPAVREAHIDQRPPIPVALFHVALDSHPQPWTQDAWRTATPRARSTPGRRRPLVLSADRPEFTLRFGVLAPETCHPREANEGWTTYDIYDVAQRRRSVSGAPRRPRLCGTRSSCCPCLAGRPATRRAGRYVRWPRPFVGPG